MRKVLIVGCPGAGKSTFARKLRDKTGLPLYYLDCLWHTPDKTTVSREEFDIALWDILKKDTWILDGNYGRTLAVRARAADTVFFFDLPTDVCLAGAAARVGTEREDMPWVETEFDPAFRQWILDFERDQRPAIQTILAETNARVITFHTRREVDAYIESFP